MIDLLLQSSSDMLNSQAQAAFYFKDLPGYFNVATYLGGILDFLKDLDPQKMKRRRILRAFFFQIFQMGRIGLF